MRKFIYKILDKFLLPKERKEEARFFNALDEWEKDGRRGKKPKLDLSKYERR